MTLQESQMTIFESLGIEDESTVSVEDSLAKAFQLLVDVEDSMTQEELYSLKSCVSPISYDHNIYSLRTSKDSSTMMGGDTFETMLRALDELGYDAEWDLCNSKDFGVPQNRERVFIIGHLRNGRGRKIFPVGGNNQAADIRIIGSTKPEKSTRLGQRDMVYSDEGLMGAINASDYKQPKQIIRIGKLDIKANDQNKRVYDSKGLSPSLTTMQGGGQEPKIIQPVLTPNRLEKRQNGRRFKDDGEPSFTITSQDRHGIYDGKRIRKLTPKECFRLQGFPDEYFHKAQLVNSDTQLYKQAGNSVTVNVIYEIAKKLEVIS